MADSDKNILITPNRGQANEPKIEFVGSSSLPITLKVLDDNSLSWEGSEGQLFSITNNLSTGTIFSVNDISGVPSIEVDADGTVVLAEFSGNVGVGTASPSHKLTVSGTLSASVGLFGSITGSLAGTATSAGSVTNSVTFNNGGAGAASGTTYNGSAARTISYNTIGAPSTSGTGASGTWGISITGNAATVTNGVYTTNISSYATTGVTAGTGLSGGGTVGVLTLNLDFSELTDMTADIAGTTEFILQNGTTESRKAASEIKLSAFNNDSGWTSNTGTVTSIATNNGITGGTITSTGTIGLTGQALALHNLATNGLITRTGSGTVAGRTIAGGTGITVTNGNGVSGNPSIALTNNSLTIGSTSVSLGGTATTIAGLTSVTSTGFSGSFSGSGVFDSDILVNSLTVGKGANSVSSNTAVGIDALGSITSGASNNAIGSSSLASATTGYNNVGLGANSLKNLTTGYDNLAIGTNSLLGVSTSFGNVGIGTSAGSINTNSFNTFIGYYAGYLNGGSGNTFIGAAAGYSSGTGNNNIIIGGYISAINTNNNLVLADGGGNIKIWSDSTHNVGIGTTSPTSKLDVSLVSTSVPSLGLRNGNTEAAFNRPQVAFSYNGTNTFNHFINTRHKSGSPATTGNAIDFYVCNGTSANSLSSGVIHNLTLESGKVGIGTTSPTAPLEVNGNIKFTSTGQGIDFSANGNAAGMTSEVLDDYEEGTWTATVVWGSTTGGTITSNYVKIGQLVYFEGGTSTVASATSTAGLVYITGLPFNVANNTNPVPAKYVGAASRTGYVPTNSYVTTAEEIITSGRPYNGGTVTAALFNFTSGSSYIVEFAGCYRTTD